MMTYQKDRRENGLWGSQPGALAIPDGICGLDDVRAVAMIDELRGAARASMASGDFPSAISHLVTACDIAMGNLVCPDVLAELACAFQACGLVEASAECRTWHREFVGYLLERGLFSEDYEDLLRRQATVCGNAAFGPNRNTRSPTQPNVLSGEVMPLA